MRTLTLSLYRVRGPIFFVASVLLLTVATFGRFLNGQLAGQIQLILIGIALLAWLLCFGLVVFGPRSIPNHDTVTVGSPVRGRWLAMNSPASQTPSHGTRAYGQAFAIDLLYETEGRPRPGFGDWPAMREPREFAAFGQPVYSMVEGVVVHASSRRRDHKSRSNLWAFAYMMAEGTIRELGGPNFVLGNHVTVRTSDGVFAVIAHLQQDSVTLQIGDDVRSGDQIGLCGNSGNTSEPHVHAQLMDRASLWTAQGIPLAFAQITIDQAAEPVNGLPRNGQHIVVDTME
jgi:hypothetical protein